VAKHISVNSVFYNVEERGSREYPPLVLLHGFTGSAASWGRHLDVFEEAGFRVIALDMLGHGKSAAPVDPYRYDIREYQADILTLLIEMDVHAEEAVLLGYSMGGRIALYTAFSGFFRGLVLESASPGIKDPIERKERVKSDEQLAERIERDGIEAFVDYWESLPLFASVRRLPEKERQALHAQRLKNSPVGLANSLRGVGTGMQPDMCEQLHKLDYPTLLITGILDSKFTNIAQEMVQVLPDAQLHVVPDAGHIVHLEQPKIFDRLVRDFCFSIQ
jgi:2-succinyl-6-hydroxy-2,4-cyclohexadiene-1-carboxylate synthase